MDGKRDREVQDGERDGRTNQHESKNEHEHAKQRTISLKTELL